MAPWQELREMIYGSDRGRHHHRCRPHLLDRRQLYRPFSAYELYSRTAFWYMASWMIVRVEQTDWQVHVASVIGMELYWRVRRIFVMPESNIKLVAPQPTL